MRALAVGLRFSMLARSAVAMLGGRWLGTMTSLGAVTLLGGVTLLGVGGCSERASAEGESASLLPERSKAEPEQVVQRIAATPNTVVARTPASSGLDGNRAVVSEAGGPAASSTRRGGHTPPSRVNNREPITSIHLEAELNRLEAELAN